jgi:hypothetical protein
MCELRQNAVTPAKDFFVRDAQANYAASGRGIIVWILIQPADRERKFMTPTSHEVTQLLLAWSAGDRGALDRLVPLVYAELHRLAKSYMRKERAGQTLQTTALIHEAYLRLIDANQVSGKTARTSSALRPASCGRSWWASPASAAVRNAAAARGRSRWTRR